MFKNFIKQFTSATIGLLMIGYIGLQLALGIGDIVEIDNVRQQTVNDVITADGFIFKDEYPLRSSSVGVNSYIVADGTKVSKNDKICAVYQNSSDAVIQDQINIIEDKIKILKSSISNSVATESEIKDIDGYIAKEILEIANSVENGDTAMNDRSELELLIHMNKRFALSTATDTFTHKIASYEAEAAALRNQFSGQGAYVSTDESGYFYSETDGFESSFSVAELQKLSADSFDGLGAIKPEQTASTVGKIAVSSRWYIAFAIEKREAAELTADKSPDYLYTIEFPLSNNTKINFKLDKKINKTDGDFAILIFTTNELPENFNFKRKQEIRLITETFTGISLPFSSLRVVDGQKGVYTLDGQIVRFKKVDILYEYDGYYICRMPMRDGMPYTVYDTLSLYDAVILSGRNMFDGKILK